MRQSKDFGAAHRTVEADPSPAGPPADIYGSHQSRKADSDKCSIPKDPHISVFSRDMCYNSYII